MNTQNIRISDYNYELPDERIAKYPLARRDQSKLLIYDKGRVGESIFCRLPDYLPKGALMVFNNTKVIQARLHFYKETGALIEIFLLEPAVPADYEQMFQTRGRCSWYCLIGNLKKWKEGELTRELNIEDGRLKIKATRRGEHGTSHLVEFEWSSSVSFAEVLDAIGELPIPPYLNRNSEESDKTTYQTVYSKIKGSVAAPTAGLHFTPEVLSAIDAKGIDREELTLHVGAGTFKPVKSEEIGGHEMHTEYFAVRRQTLEKLLRHDCQAIAVGTTSVRTLESLYYIGLRLQANPNLTAEQLHIDQWEPYGLNTQHPTPSTQLLIRNILDWLDRNHQEVFHGSTQIIIAPGYEYKIVRMLVTNFHQPQSTLLLLVSAFVHGDWHTIYDYALSHDFRFLSYGDSSLLIP
ncbi:MAG: S-adenosylmethionine:tRNA ribosyltransferase-isomerase [Prevotella sp.]|nr:S-adenosylmethionine:tRNA ribosyltransferase-isomerase [Prevotella sp.]